MLTAIGCSASLDFSGDTESRALGYKQYVADGGDGWFDPVGASDIYQRCCSTRDGYDAWWRFTISQENCDQLVITVAADNNGPDAVEWNETTAYPAEWNPVDSAPSWWGRNAGKNTKSIHWCYQAGSAERHHGWYFLYDPVSQRMWCWHWNHQWSSAKCNDTSNPM